ncbi:carbohydrate ABC transporter permease [Acidaminobacter sp. JC074]|uniref:carbohydrate ABC transporter permease n=1 Tax=Acidaminobacter sp. JC074 TaxID=2530199 RepID=UPI001F10F36F|nr:carbohydrate ABC transporter permease [Acidaminobacter sp. JC074]MCH4886185.1 carbohydrate ABC transporter permease [Acidaminobacter sp. JC074]
MGNTIEGRSEKIFKWVNIVLLVVIGFSALYPLVYILSASVSLPSAVETGEVVLLPKGFNLESYKEALKTPNLWVAYGNTLYYTVVGTIVNMAFTTLGAYVLSRKNMPFLKAITLFVLVTMWLKPGIIPMYLNFRDLGLINSRWSIVLGFAISTFNLIILRTFFSSIPESLDEAARIDGANHFTIFRKIYLPLSKSALATITMFYAVSRWNGYFWSMVLLQDDSKIPLQVLLKKLIVEQSTGGEEAVLITPDALSSPQTIIFAIIMISIIPMLIAYPYIQRFFKEGVMIGSVKG